MAQDDGLRAELVMANRILAHENVLDAFGHVSARAPGGATYFISRSRSPEIVEIDDILELDLQSRPLDPDAPPRYSESVIHGSIYQLRPDVGAVCHFHAPAIMPFCITGAPLVPVFHLGATMGPAVPLWSAQAAFGDTDLLVSTAEQGLSLAKALGDGWVVLMESHGAVVAGRNVREAVFRAIQTCRNAQYQLAAGQLGAARELTEAERAMAEAFNLRPQVLQRAWEYWGRRCRYGTTATDSTNHRPDGSTPTEGPTA